METAAGDILHCEERLRSALHSDDKEKLRRKLAELQREYFRTAQRLQRAERSEAVKRHVRSRIADQNHQDQTGTEAASDLRLSLSSLVLNGSSDTAQGLPQCRGRTEGPADSDNSGRNQVIGFLLPADAACPQTPDPSHAAPTGHRPSSSLRLRSRRSRLRWESRSAEPASSEKGQKQSEGMEDARRAGEEEKLTSEGADAVNESEELFSGTDSESPSLLLTHWSTHGCAEMRDIRGKDIPGSQEQNEKNTESKDEGEKESESLLLTSCNHTIQTEESGQDDTQNGRRKEVERVEVGENSRGQNEENINKDTEQNVEEKTESKHSRDNSVELKEEKNGSTRDGKSTSLLDSCTLVEGLLFPVEYYVRTTRRMTLSQSQPDMQAVIASQLSRGRHRRSRGRGRGQNRNTHTSDHSGQHSQTNSSSLTIASADPNKQSQAVCVSAEHSQSAGEISDHISACQIDSSFSPTVTTVRAARGRRRKRGMGRGRSQTPRASLSLNIHRSAGDPQPTSTPIPTWQSVQGADGPDPCPIPEETNPATDEPQHVSTHITDSLLSSGVNGVPSASGHPEKVYQIFMKRNIEATRSPHMNRSTSSWRSLLLPSSSLAQTSLLPLPSLLSGPLNLDTHQDFHLPDDQFASLKLLKLRQVARESAVEPFSSPSYNTRSSWRRSDFQCSSDPAMPLPLPLSLTPTIANSARHNEEHLASTHSIDIQNVSIECKLTDKVISQSFAEEQQTENFFAEPHSISTEPKSVVQKCADDSVEEEHETVTLNSSVRPQTHMNSADRTASTENDYVIDQSDKVKYPAPEKQTHFCGVAHPSEPLRCINHQAKDKVVIETVFFESPLQEAPSSSCTVLQACNNVKPPGESPVKPLKVPSSPTHSNKPSEPNADLSPNRLSENQTKCSQSVNSQLLLNSPLASVPCSFVTPHVPSSTLTTSPKLPSLGLTPHPITCSLRLTSSPSAPFLTLPPPHSPSTQALSPPALSPSHSITCLPPSLPPFSPSSQIQASSEPPVRANQHHTVETATPLTPSNHQLEDSAGQFGLRTEEKTEELVIRHMQTLKAAAGGILVDACCFPGPSGGLCVAAAGKWAVCLWSQASASEWKLTHTWTFSEPVINVFPVPDAAGLICVTLGQLEIREVRILPCSSLMEMLLCEGVLQAAVGVSESRVVTTSHSATGSTLQVFMLSDYSSPSCQPLVSPGVCVGALATVDELPDALIGTDEGGHLFVWNLKTGQLLCRVFLGEGFSHTACLRGYSSCGVLFVLLQHQFLSSLEEEEKEAKIKAHRTALLSLVAINPLSGKSIPATQLYPPETWTGRLCEVDISGSSVVGLSQNGCVCVWELRRPGASRMVWAPETEGWQLARWGGGDTLVTGHHNGDVTLHCYSQTPLCC